MQNQDFTITISVPQTPQEAFNAITNFRGWWSENIEGTTDTPGSAFTYRYKDIHVCRLMLIEELQDRKLVYRVLDNHFSVFSKDKTEWVNTLLVFDISDEGGKTKIKFTHAGLVPDYDCYEVCSIAWSTYVGQSLYKLITTGQGEPTPMDEDGINAGILKERNLID